MHQLPETWRRWSGIGGIVCTAVLSAACATSTPPNPTELAQALLTVDTHIDVPYRLHKAWADVSQATSDGEFDYPRAKAGGLDALFMSIYIPASVDEAGEGGSLANELIDQVEAMAGSAPDKFQLATCTSDVVAAKAAGRVAMPLGMENGGPLRTAADLAHFQRRGIRYVTLAHSKSNHISDSSYDTNEKWQGLSPYGQRLVRDMNNAGVLVDVSHVSDAAFWQVLETSATPVIASHSSLRHFTPGFHRNMSDKMVVALGKSGGVVQINFGSGFLTAKARDWSMEREKNTAAHMARFMTNQGAAAHLTPEEMQADPEAKAHMDAYLKSYRDTYPYPFADVSDVLDHIDRAVELAGINAVGLGSDYDGVGDSLPTGLKDVSDYPNLVAGLLARGYRKRDIGKILGGNVMRVWRAAEAYASSQGNPPDCRT